MQHYKPRSIEEMGGLRVYLDATRNKHGNNGYEDFILRIDIANRRKLAELFCVTEDTIYRWLKIRDRERGRAK